MNENRKDEIWSIMNYVSEYEGEFEDEEDFKFDD